MRGILIYVKSYRILRWQLSEGYYIHLIFAHYNIPGIEFYLVLYFLYLLYISYQITHRYSKIEQNTQIYQPVQLEKCTEL